MKKEEISVKAQLVLDENGKPQFIQSGQTRHYQIKLFVDNVPDDTYAVTYKLHESYYDPIRESRNKQVGFIEEITSYGDYSLSAKVRTKNHTSNVMVQLSDALEDYYRDEVNPEIENAIKYIKQH